MGRKLRSTVVVSFDLRIEGFYNVAMKKKTRDIVDDLLSKQADMTDISAPLKQFGIKGFSYSKICNDGRFFTLTTNTDYALHHFKQFFNCEYTPEDIQQGGLLEGFSLWESKRDSRLWQDANQFGLGHGLLLSVSYKSYKELFCFSSDVDNEKIKEFYINNSDVLYSYTYLFKDKAYKIMRQAEQNMLMTPLQYKSTCMKSRDGTQRLKHAFYQNATIKRFYIDDDTYLTLKEAQCLYWIAKGKSAEEIGSILSAGKRTIESHIERLKLKLNCYKQTDLVREAVQLGILSFFDARC